MNKKGFTLIEIVMIIVLLGIIMPGIMLYFMQGVKDSAKPQRRNTAIFLAEALMEEIKSKRWDETAAINSTCSNASATLGFEVGETRIGGATGFDDIDDFNGLNNMPPNDSQNNPMNNYPGYRQQVAVRYVDPTNLEGSAASPPTCYKRIQVDITDTTSNETVSLVSLMTYY